MKSPAPFQQGLLFPTCHRPLPPTALLGRLWSQIDLANLSPPWLWRLLSPEDASVIGLGSLGDAVQCGQQEVGRRVPGNSGAWRDAGRTAMFGHCNRRGLEQLSSGARLRQLGWFSLEKAP